MPQDEGGDGTHDPTEPPVPPEPAPDKPPLLDYPAPVSEGDFGETESWAEVGRAILIVFGVLGLLFLVTFGLCGVFANGCG
jgi:hypothetical protein